jgi:hypothetical protein
MKFLTQLSTVALSVGIFAGLSAPPAYAGCGDLSSLQGPFQLVYPNLEPQAIVQRVANADFNDRGGPPNAGIVGMWRFQLISKGNAGHNPSIPDGALLDFGYQHWHSDGTEFVESGLQPPAGANFCLGVWGQTGFLTYTINHFPIGYNPTTGAIANFVNAHEQITLSPSGDSYSGRFTIDVYDLMGNHVDHLAGNIVAKRITVDSTLPGAIPSNP